MILPGVIASSGGVASSYESIATTTVGSGGATSITFSSLGTGYTHLQLRYFASQNAAQYQIIQLGFSGGAIDTGANYAQHYVYGNGSTTGAGGNVASGATSFAFGDLPASTTIFGAGIMDILNYSNTTTYKTLRVLGGNDQNGSGVVVMSSCVNISTTGAITSLKLTPGGGGTGYKQYSSFALYGVKA